MTTCLITGCNRGIGLALLESALAHGWSVIGLHRSAMDHAAHPSLSLYQLDVTDHDRLQQIASEIEQPIDIVINNAGITGPTAANQTGLSMDYDGFAEVLNVNVIAALRVTHAFLPHLRRADRPRILSISSQMSSMGTRPSNLLAYRTSKAALNKVMQGVATDLESENIPVSLINPGWVRTEMGGGAADLDANDVALGIIKVAEGLSMADTGRMIRWSGERTTFWEVS